MWYYLFMYTHTFFLLLERIFLMHPGINLPFYNIHFYFNFEMYFYIFFASFRSIYLTEYIW